MQRRLFLQSTAAILGLLPACKKEEIDIAEIKTIMFLGDSITYQGHYIKQIQLAYPNIKLINKGLVSETVSGLSEEIHSPPRPVLFDRLDAVLKDTKPDLVVFLYGINDAIYAPYDKTRFEKYKAGIKRFLNTIKAAKLKVVMLSPPPFVLSASKKIEIENSKETSYSYIKPYINYQNEVMVPYKNYVMGLKHSTIVKTIDIFTPLLNNAALSYSESDPIHPNENGHRIMAEAIMKGVFKNQ